MAHIPMYLYFKPVKDMTVLERDALIVDMVSPETRDVLGAAIALVEKGAHCPDLKYCDAPDWERLCESVKHLQVSRDRSSCRASTETHRHKTEQQHDPTLAHIATTRQCPSVGIMIDAWRAGMLWFAQNSRHAHPCLCPECQLRTVIYRGLQEIERTRTSEAAHDS